MDLFQRKFLVNAQEKLMDRSFNTNWDVNFDKPWEWMTNEELTEYYSFLYALQIPFGTGRKFSELSEVSFTFGENKEKTLQEIQREIHTSDEDK